MVINEANTGNQGGGAGGSGYQMSGPEKAVMYGTIGGMYSVDDSPAAIAGRTDLAQLLMLMPRRSINLLEPRLLICILALEAG